MGLFWLIILAVCVVAEYHTNAFVAFFVAVGSLVSFVLALLGVPIWIQAVAWFAVSLVGILTIRPFAVRRFHFSRSSQAMAEPAAGPLTGKSGTVEVEVGDALNPGRVKLEGQSWRAVTEADAAFPAGTQVVVDKVQGTTLWVVAAPSKTPSPAAQLPS